MKKYDAIVVGAGHNGLANAAFLAKAGMDVLCVGFLWVFFPFKEEVLKPSKNRPKDFQNVPKSIPT